MNYNNLEKIIPRWRGRWKRKLIDFNGSVGVIVPKPIIDSFGKAKGKIVSMGWVVDEKTGRDLLVIDFE